MKLNDRKVCTPLSVLTPRDSGTLIAAQPNMEGWSRRSWRDLGADPGWLAGGRAAAQLMRLAAAAAIAVLCGAPMASAQSLGTVALGSSSAATPVSVTVATGGTLDTISVSTQGISSLDFSNTGGGTCAVSTAYTSGESCTVEVTFSPTTPGLRLGAVELRDSSGNLLGTGYIYGTGRGSLLRYNPGTQAVLYSSLSSPQAMVVDAGSNIYIADTLDHLVRKLPWNGSSYGTAVNVGSGWSAPSGVAVDGAGNVYVADAALGGSAGEVVEVPWTGSAYGTQVTIGAYPFAQDLTIDGSGNLYILTSATTITKLPWNGTGYGASSTFGSGLSGGQYNTDVVDSSGNIYIADYNLGNLVKETPSGPSYNQTILGNFGAASIDGVAVDPAGDVYLAQYSPSKVLMLPWTGGGYGTAITLTSNGSLVGPEAIYLDGIGNIYVESFNSHLVEKWSVTELPTLTFPTSTNVGSSDTADNPQTVSLLNVGNAALTILVPDAGNNPSIASGFSYAESSTCPQLGTSSGAASLASAASCTYAVNFDPTEAGTNSGALVLTDNYLGATSATQSIGLTGTGISLVTKLTFGGTPATPIALGGNAGSLITVDERESSNVVDSAASDLITLTVTGPSSYLQTYTATAVDGGATFNLSSVALNVSGSYTYTASLASVTSAIATETVNSATPQTITFTPSSQVTYGVAPIPLLATGGASGNAVTFSILSGGSFGSLSGNNNSMLTVTGAGTITIAANQAGNTNYAAATQVTASIVVSNLSQTITFSPASPVTFGVAPITLSAIGGASGNAVTFSITSGNSFGSLGGANNSTLTVTGAGTITIAANQAGNTNYAAATQATASILITKASLSIVVNPASSVYGAAFPTFSGTLTGALPADGITASYSTTATPTSPAGGSYSIVATLNDPNSKLGNYSVTNTPAPLSIGKAASAVQVSSSVNPVLLSDPTTLTATVSSTAGQPTGTITFLDNATPIGSAPLSSGAATLTLSSLAVGSHSLSAVYSSDTNFSASTSGVLTQSVIDFTTTPGGSGSGGTSGASQTVTPGSAATFSLSIVPTSGASFPTPATLTITGIPAGATATVSPLSWAQTTSTSWTYPANTPLTNVVLTIQLPSATARMDGKVPFGRDLPPVLWSLLLVPFVGRLRRKLSRLGQTMSVLLLLGMGCAMVAGVSGCGSSNGFFNQPQQTYKMNVTVSSGALSHSSTITLTVE
jgi:hypothetical protein